MLTHPLGQFRLVALAEGVSYVVLVGIGMPLKYLADLPETVLVVGWMHGVLFMLYMALLARVVWTLRWGLVRIAQAVVASLVPGGTFVLDLSLRKEHQALLQQSETPEQPAEA